jgi:hypothetical protein
MFGKLTVKYVDISLKGFLADTTTARTGTASGQKVRRYLCSLVHTNTFPAAHPAQTKHSKVRTFHLHQRSQLTPSQWSRKHSKFSPTATCERRMTRIRAMIPNQGIAEVAAGGRVWREDLVGDDLGLRPSRRLRPRICSTCFSEAVSCLSLWISGFC